MKCGGDFLGALKTLIRVGVLLFVCSVLAVQADAQRPGRRRALLIGINDYSSAQTAPREQLPAGRDWPDLSGSVRDARAMAELLVLLYGFERRDIVLLTDQQASRAAILRGVEAHLAAPAAKGDVVFFYYAGHGSQVRNSLSDEPDKLDESLVPADSRSGARDIRDKELRGAFNRILDRGARLTILLDNCHSGSGARGLATGARPRSVRADPRDVADGSAAGPRPEDRGALVLSAAQDFDAAWETRDEEGNIHGAFSWAWMRALRDAAPGEPAIETFLRTQARLRVEVPYQEPVIAGDSSSRLSPFLGVRTDRRGARALVAVERVQSDGTVLLQGGWASGLAVGSELRLVSAARADVRVTVTALDGLGQSRARIEPPARVSGQWLQSGALLEIVGWAAPAGQRLRVWMPDSAATSVASAAIGRAIAAEAAKRRLRWISDPTAARADYLLRWNGREWELVGANGVARAGTTRDEAVAALARVPAGASLFVQLPPPAALVNAVAIDRDRDGVQPVARAEDADYILAGRYAGGRVEYAWIRPATMRTDRRRSGLPLRTAWTAGETSSRESALMLRDAALRLRRIYGWCRLESPPAARFPYTLALRRASDGELAKDEVAGEERYELALRAGAALPALVVPRYVYIFVIDSHGRAVLLYPRSGSVENRFPLAAGGEVTNPPREIPLGNGGAFEIAPPYGVDTYLLLTTDEPLPNPWILEWDAVRGAAPRVRTPLEELLLAAGGASRSVLAVTPSTWSIERRVFESLPPRSATTRRR